jgi:hypothetical protein
MDFSLPADLWSSVIPISLVVGAAGGLAWDIGNAVRPSKDEPKTGIDNMLELPRIYKAKGGKWMIDLGLLGPLLVGAVGAVLLVLIVGPTPPSAEETAKGVIAANSVTHEAAQPQSSGTETEPPAEAKATEVVEEELPSKIPAVQLVVLALLGGLGGWGLLQTLTTRMSSLLDAAVGKTVDHVKAEAEKTVRGAADGLKPDELAKLVGETVKKAGGTALRPTPSG